MPFADNILCKLLLGNEVSLASFSKPVVALAKSLKISLAVSGSPFKKRDIEPSNLGNFQFGLVSGYLDGYIEQIGKKERFTFTWSGQDEMDEALGSGWVELNGDEEITGLIKLHLGDRSTFQAKRVS